MPPPDLAGALALGLLQGPAEVLPVSSSAHVALLARRLRLGDEDAELRKALEVAVHLGSLVALLPGEPLRGGDTRTILVATAITALAGRALERPVEQRLGGPRATSAGLVVGSALLLWADAIAAVSGSGPPATGAPEPLSAAHAPGPWRSGLALGVAQALALWPGVSRSGATLATARALGHDPAGAARIARRVGLPALAGAVALKGWRISRTPRALPALAAAAGAAALSTAAARPLGRAAEGPLWPWAVYRLVLAGALMRDTPGR